MDFDNGTTRIYAFDTGDVSSIGTRWIKWLDRFENYIDAVNVYDPRRVKALMLHLAGESVFEIYNSLPDPPSIQNNYRNDDEREDADAVEEDEYDLAKRKLVSYFVPKTNLNFEIFNFRQAKQLPNELLDQFYARLLKLSSHCEFADKDAEIKSQIILTTNSSNLRRYGLREQLTLEQLLSYGRSLETTQVQLTAIETSSNNQSFVNFNKYRKSSFNKNNINSSGNRFSNSNKFNNSNGFNNSDRFNNNNKCKNCGNGWHENGLQFCPAKNFMCHICGKQGHFAKVCISGKNKQQFNSPQNNNRSSNSNRYSNNSTDDNRNFNIRHTNNIQQQQQQQQQQHQKQQQQHQTNNSEEDNVDSCEEYSVFCITVGNNSSPINNNSNKSRNIATSNDSSFNTKSTINNNSNKSISIARRNSTGCSTVSTFSNNNNININSYEISTITKSSSLVFGTTFNNNNSINSSRNNSNIHSNSIYSNSNSINSKSINSNSINSNSININSNIARNNSLNNNNNENNQLPKVLIEVNNTVIDFVIDTGSSINIISMNTFKTIKNHPRLISTKNEKIFPYNSSSMLPIIGKFEGNLMYKNKLIKTPIFVINSNAQSLLSFKTSTDLGIIERFNQIDHENTSEYVVTNFPKLLNGSGVLKNYEVHLHTDQMVQPVVQKQFRTKSEMEIKQLLVDDKIEQAVDTTLLVSPIVVIPKPNDNDSRIITTLRNLPRYKCLSFGISSAVYIFQNVIRQTLSNMSIVINIIDDIFNAGKSKAEHDKLIAVRRRLEQSNLTTNFAEWIFNQTTINYFGFVFARDGIYADPNKVTALKSMNTTKDPYEVRSLLGTLNYVATFLSNLATRILCKLVNQRFYNDSEQHQVALNYFKQFKILNRLVYFDTSKQFNVYIDPDPSCQLKTTRHSTEKSSFEIICGRTAKTQLPDFCFEKNQRISTPVQIKDYLSSEKYKGYADSKRRTKINKLTLSNDLRPYIVPKVSGSTISARREEKIIVCNSSHFKRFYPIPVSSLSQHLLPSYTSKAQRHQLAFGDSTGGDGEVWQRLLVNIPGTIGHSTGGNISTSNQQCEREVLLSPVQQLDFAMNPPDVNKHCLRNFPSYFKSYELSFCKVLEECSVVQFTTLV